MLNTDQLLLAVVDWSHRWTERTWWCPGLHPSPPGHLPVAGLSDEAASGEAQGRGHLSRVCPEHAEGMEGGSKKEDRRKGETRIGRVEVKERE